MSISNYMMMAENKGSAIRKMFERGSQLKAEFGADKVYDFSIGNPSLPAPEGFRRALRGLAEDDNFNHGYMPNAGYADVREAVSRRVSYEQETPVPADNILMTCGAAGGLNVIFKAILDPGSEVVVTRPYFMEYGFYCDTFGAKLVTVPAMPDFDLDAQAVLAAVTPKTKAVLINSPNNPTGRIYSKKALQELAEGLGKLGHPVYIISDEPYRHIAYGSRKVEPLFPLHPYTILTTSCSKDMSIAGERMGWIAVNPAMPEAGRVMGACIMANRVLGFINAPAIIQKAVAACINDLVDVSVYAGKRDLLTGVLREAGYEFILPDGAFYLFVRSPIRDDAAFCDRLAEERILAVPGRSFDAEGWFRLAFCCEDATITNSKQGFINALKKAKA